MWLPLTGYESTYEISETQGIRRVGASKSISQTGSVYKRVHLCKDGKKKKHSVHRLIALHFLKKISGKNEVNHKDGNHFNNSLENLEWVTPGENIRHSYDVLNRRNSITKYVLNTQTGIFYNTIKEAALTTNYSYQSIRFKLSGRWPNNTNFITI